MCNFIKLPPNTIVIMEENLHTILFSSWARSLARFSNCFEQFSIISKRKVLYTESEAVAFRNHEFSFYKFLRMSHTPIIHTYESVCVLYLSLLMQRIVESSPERFVVVNMLVFGSTLTLSRFLQVYFRAKRSSRRFHRYVFYVIESVYIYVDTFRRMRGSFSASSSELLKGWLR